MRMPSAATATPPFSSVRKPSTSAVGQAERLARVRFLTRPSSRKLSRNRMAGGEPRLGTDSMYMASLLALRDHASEQNPIHYMGTPEGTNGAGAAENHRLCALSSKNFGLKAQSPRTAKKLAGTLFRPSLNREASRLGVVRVRRPSSRAQVPETRRDKHRVCERWTFQPRPTSRNFFWLVCKNCNALKPAAVAIGGRTLRI